MNYNTPQYSQFVADSSQDVRATFIRKVYTLLFGSILTTVIAGYVASGFIQTIIPLMPIIGIATFVCFLGLLFTKQIPVVNAALFFLFAILQGAVITLPHDFGSSTARNPGGGGLVDVERFRRFNPLRFRLEEGLQLHGRILNGGGYLSVGCGNSNVFCPCRLAFNGLQRGRGVDLRRIRFVRHFSDHASAATRR